MDDVGKKIEKAEKEAEEASDHSWAYQILSQLKQTTNRLWWVIIALAAIVVFQYGINTYERMQYDYSTTYEANGFYAIIDSDGNIIAQDITEEELGAFKEWWEINGNSSGN